MATYTTQQGDYWDLISYRLFGSEFYVDQLFKANMQFADVAVFAAGTVLQVPVINEQQIVNLPPWERPSALNPQQSEQIPTFDFVYNRGFSYRFIERWIKQMNDIMYNELTEKPEKIDQNLWYGMNRWQSRVNNAMYNNVNENEV